MEALNRLADRLDEAAAVLAAARPAERDPEAAATGADNPGRLGEVTGNLDRQRSAALHARAQEAATAGSRLGALAADLRTAAAGYSDVDEAAHARTASMEQR